MASTLNVVLCALVASSFWTLLGAAVGRHVWTDRTLVLPLAPALGWATFSAAALPIFLLVGFTTTSLAAVALSSMVVALIVLASATPPPQRVPEMRLPLFAWLTAAAIAVVPAAAAMPKISESGVALSAPIFDHAKIALIDSLIRLGLPPVNPVFGGGGATGVSYYYLWHFSASTAALATGVSGWEADAAVAWFTAWSSLALIMGLAVWLSRRASAWIWALALAPVGSLRPVLEWLLGPDAMAALLRPETGLAGWLFQSSWSPQHVQSACCAVLTLLLVADLPRRKGLAVPAMLALVVAAGFQSSLWIGGVVVPIAGAAAAIAVLRDADWSTRQRFAVASGSAALCAGALSSPLLIAQYQASLLRAVTSPLAIAPQEVLGPLFPDSIRRILDLPAFWSVFLVIAFPAVYPLGVVVLFRFSRLKKAAAPMRDGASLATLAATSLLITWVMVSSVGDNNDLGWRAVLPGLLVLTALAAAGLADAPSSLPRAARIAASALILIGLPRTIDIALHDLLGSRPTVYDAAFARSVDLWEAVRRHSKPADRVASNPLFLQELTLWPVNLSWALLADRSSCYAGREMALAFAPLTAERREALDRQFVRVFNGNGTADDVRDLALRYDCRIAVVTSRDGAWARDPFADSPLYRLVEDEAGRWRIYGLQAEASPGP